jgi:hypothetical protein
MMGKRRFHESLETATVTRDIMNGKVVAKKKLVRTVTAVRTTNRAVVESNAEFLHVITAAFEDKWAGSQQGKEALLARLMEGGRIVLSTDEIIMASHLCKKPNQLDVSGVCGEALNCYLLVASGWWTRWFNALVNSDVMLGDINVVGPAEAKQAGVIDGNGARALLPQPKLLESCKTSCT